MGALQLGPVLGLESEILYTICFSTASTITDANWIVDGTSISCQKVGTTPSSIVWKGQYEIPVGQSSKTCTYQIALNGLIASSRTSVDQWSFYVPSEAEQPLISYVSCNGFSSMDLMHKTQNPYELWDRMAQHHQTAPFSLMLMGGDQLYADNIWNSVSKLGKWNSWPHEKKVKTTAISKDLLKQIDRFYDNLYHDRWSSPSMSLMLASVPSLMMWDDHDIFDGWGSFPDDIQNSAYFQTIFKTAKKYFELFQIRSRNNKSLLDNEANHYAFALKFRGYDILALDNRSERSLNQVMSSDSQWPLLNEYLENLNTGNHLLLMSAVPVVYRDFSFVESSFDYTPWEEELTDDLKDHWRSKNHEGERARLIHRLLENAKRRGQKTVILSGDVHLGCIGVIHDRTDNCKIHQIVSSGIVHPSPSRIQWLGIMATTNDRDEYLDENKDVLISMLKPFASEAYIRARNYVTLEIGTDKDKKLWVNWESEGKDNPYYPID